MRITILYFLFLFLAYSSSFAQSQDLQGTYEGKFGQGKIVGIIKQNDDFIIGSLFQSHFIKYSFNGITENDTIKGDFFLNAHTKLSFHGVIRNQKLLLFLHQQSDSSNHFIPIFLDKTTTKTEVKLDDYFGKIQREYNPMLIGTWKLIKRTDLEGNDIKFDSFTFSMKKNGLFEYAEKLSSEKSTNYSKKLNNSQIGLDFKMKWYNLANKLYIGIEELYPLLEEPYYIEGNKLVITCPLGNGTIDTHIKKD